MQPWFTVYFDIAHLCYDQLTPVKARYPLTSMMWPYHGLKCTAHRGYMLFWSWPLTKCWFSIGSRAHVRLTCWKQGRIVGNPVKASPGLKFIRIITFSSIQMFLLLCFEYIYVIHQLGGPYWEKLCPRCRERTRDRGHSFSQYGPTKAGE